MHERYRQTTGLTGLLTIEKDLGVYISNDAKPSVHCQQIYLKANRMLGFVKRNIIISRHPSILLNMYKSFVRPHLEYCSPAWSPHYQKDEELPEKVQHRFTRMFRHLRQLDYCTRLDILGLWSLEERRNRADFIEVFSITRREFFLQFLWTRSLKLTKMVGQVVIP